MWKDAEALSGRHHLEKQVDDVDEDLEPGLRCAVKSDFDVTDDLFRDASLLLVHFSCSLVESLHAILKGPKITAPVLYCMSQVVLSQPFVRLQKCKLVCRRARGLAFRRLLHTKFYRDSLCTLADTAGTEKENNGLLATSILPSRV